MTLPEVVSRALADRFEKLEIVSRVGGGCINPAYHLRHAGGELFLKCNPNAPPGMFAAEAEGLKAMREADSGLLVPEVIEVGEPGDNGAGWLLLEWLSAAPGTAMDSAALGSGLAALHRSPGGRWGWHRDGFIGSLPQRNTPAGSWADFWREARLEPQLQRAEEQGYDLGPTAHWRRLFQALPGLLGVAEADGPSLLHGDLWGGNVLAASCGAGIRPALVDPAAYHGHREVDLAMSELFGGFDRGFYAAYERAWPLEPGYRPRRRAVYQLFYLLVHVNLFGAAYIRPTRDALERALAG